MSERPEQRGVVLVIGTADTKGDELEYIADTVRARGVGVIAVDVGTTPHDRPAWFTADDIGADTVASAHPDGASAVGSDDRGEAVGAMSVALEHFVQGRNDVIGAIGIGGSGGTALIAPALRALPIGTPKVLVSTVASGQVGPYVGPADIAMMYSVTDVAGLNGISRVVLGNAANAVAGMAGHPVPPSRSDRPALGLTMFGLTTPLVSELVGGLRDQFDPLVFHATGTGGKSMEKLVGNGMIIGVLDMTTTEVADMVVGGVFPAGPERFDVIARTRVPYVGSCGALDMVNFGARNTIPSTFDHRLFHVHNSEVTLMRTTPDENVQFGEFIATKLNACEGSVRFLVPEGGVSGLDAPGQSFWDPEADAALFDTIEQQVHQTNDRQVRRHRAHINDPEFAMATLSAFNEVMET